VFPLRFSQAIQKGLLELGERLIIPGVETLLLDRLPEPFDQIQVGSIGGQTEPFEASYPALDRERLGRIP